MTLYDICKRLNCSYDELTGAVIELLEITGFEVYTKEILDEMQQMYEAGE